MDELDRLSDEERDLLAEGQLFEKLRGTPEFEIFERRVTDLQAGAWEGFLDSASAESLQFQRGYAVALNTVLEIVRNGSAGAAHLIAQARLRHEEAAARDRESSERNEQNLARMSGRRHAGNYASI